MQRKRRSLGGRFARRLFEQKPAKKSEKKLVCLGWQSARAELTRLTRSDLACLLPSYQSIRGSEQPPLTDTAVLSEAETFSLGGARQR